MPVLVLKILDLESARCDGVSDCKDDADEKSCDSCSSDSFRCDNGDCKQKSIVCNGEVSEGEGVKWMWIVEAHTRMESRTRDHKSTHARSKSNILIHTLGCNHTRTRYRSLWVDIV